MTVYYVPQLPTHFTEFADTCCGYPPCLQMCKLYWNTDMTCAILFMVPSVNTCKLFSVGHKNRSYNLFLLSGIYNPCEFQPPHSWDYMITHKDTSQSVGLLWTSDQSVAETSTWQHTQHSQQTNIHALGGVGTRNPSRRLSADPRLGPLGHWNRRSSNLVDYTCFIIFNLLMVLTV
jgi:hypothetical protein